MISFIFIISYFFWVDKYVGLLQFFTLLILILVSYYKGNDCIAAAEKSHRHYLTMTETIQDNLNNLMSIYASQTEDDELEKNSLQEKIHEDRYMATLNCSLKIEVFTNAITLVSFVIFNGLLYKLIKEEKLEYDLIITLYICEIYYWIVLLRRVQNNMGETMSSFGALRSITSYLKTMRITRSSNRSKKDVPKKIAKNGCIVEIINVSFKYPNSDSYIIKGLNLRIRKGERIWLSGDSGIGKSTLLKLLMGFFQPSEGDIYIGSQKYNTMTTNVSKIRREITFLNQETKLFNSTLFENMTYGSKVKKEEVLSLLKSMNISIFNKLSDGIDTNVGIGGGSISGGQKQITLLIRLYFRKANIILMDEPISAIDAHSMPEVLKVISFISKDKTLIIVSHNDKIKPIISRVIKI
jgi:ATP-binding cassette subfamily B protein